jgi:hypothetical protein
MVNFACSQRLSPPIVYNFDNQSEFTEYSARDMDKTHPNLMNPEIAKDEFAIVREHWIQLHQTLGQYLEDSNFKWNTKEEDINIVHKIYFYKNGKIKAHFFNILNVEVENETKEHFAQSLEKFAQDYTFDLRRKSSYAQCGKTRYFNKSE